MSRHALAILVVAACWTTGTASAQEALPAPVVVQPTPGEDARAPVNTTPPSPAAPIKVEAPEPSPGSSSSSPNPDSSEAAGQRRGGGSGGGSRGRRPSGGGGRGYGGQPGRPYPGGRPPVGWGAPVYFARPYYYDPFWVSGAFGWSPLFYAPWPLMWGTAGYWPGPWLGSTTFNTGGVRLKVKPREAQVLVDGYYAGIVNEFDGVFQSLRLAPGGHKIEVRLDGYETLSFDVHVQPDRTMTLTRTMTTSP